MKKAIHLLSFLAKAGGSDMILDIVIIAGELAATVFSIEKHGWWKQFRYYTQCSNYILLFVTLVHLCLLLMKKKMPEAVDRCRYYATCLTTVTFVVTVCILIPWYGHPSFFLIETNGLFYHLLCPLFAIAQLPFITCIRKKDTRLAMIPTVVYGIVLYTLNFLKVVDGPYPFLKVYEQPWYMSILWFLILAALAFGIAVVLWKICGRKQRKQGGGIR